MRSVSKLRTANVIWDMIADSIAWKHLLFRPFQTSQTANVLCVQKLSIRTVTRSLWRSLFSHARKKSKWTSWKPRGEKAFLNPLYSTVHLSSLKKCCWKQTKHNHPHDNSCWHWAMSFSSVSLTYESTSDTSSESSAMGHFAELYMAQCK